MKDLQTTDGIPVDIRGANCSSAKKPSPEVNRRGGADFAQDRCGHHRGCPEADSVRTDLSIYRHRKRRVHMPIRAPLVLLLSVGYISNCLNSSVTLGTW